MVILFNTTKKLHLHFIERIGDWIEYTVINPQGKPITDRINLDEIEGLRQAVGDPLELKSVKPFFSKILEITSEKNQTLDCRFLSWINRSTMNSSAFLPHALAELCFYFDIEQKDFRRPTSTLALYMHRSLAFDAVTKIRAAVDKTQALPEDMEMRENYWLKSQK